MASLRKDILSLATLFILVVDPFELVTVFVFVHSRALLQSCNEIALKEQLVATVKLAFAVKQVVLPLPRVLIIAVEGVAAFTLAIAIHELTLVDVFVGVHCLA